LDLGDLSDDEFFDMGQYNLDRDLMINPNNKLHNLFGGASASPKKRKLSGESGASHRHGKDEYNFSESSQDEEDKKRKPQDVAQDERAFAEMYGINTTVEGALARARKMGIPTMA
jgi:hypothetical protein